jgi:hypothetical protein
MNTKFEVTAKPEVATPRPLDLTELAEVSAAGFWGELGSLYFETGLRLAAPLAANVLYGKL